MKKNFNAIMRRGKFNPFLFIFILLWIWAGSLFATAEWTVLVYMAADNGLSEYAKQDINDMESITIPSNTNVIVQADFPGTSNPAGAYRYKINHGVTDNIESQVLANLGEIDSGDYNTLKSFMNWGFSHYPAQHKALVIWSHGDSWYKGNDNKWICPDDSEHGIMSVAGGDLRNALVNCPPLDILLFDACSMQSIEVVNEVSDKAKYVIGSEDIVPAYGFPYQDILPVWQGEADILVELIPDLYVSSYAPYGSQNPYGYIVNASCSTLDTEYLNDVNSHLFSFIMHEIAAADTIFTARELCYNLNTYEAEIDLKEFLHKAATLLAPDNNADFVQPLLEAIQSLVVSKAAINYSPDVGYLTIWFPRDQDTFYTFWQRYSGLRVSEQWLGLVSAALGADTGTPLKPGFFNTVLLFNDLRVLYWVNPTPEFIRIKMQYIHDNVEFADKETLCTWMFYNPNNTNHASTINDIQGSGWLYIQAEDYDGNLSPKDSTYVKWSAPKPELFIYPNPCRNSRAIYFNWWSDADNYVNVLTENEVRIYDIKGRLVQTIKPLSYKQGSSKVDLSHLPSGIYIARVKIGKQELTNKFTLLSDD